jgi:hypothetical protein
MKSRAHLRITEPQYARATRPRKTILYVNMYVGGRRRTKRMK